MKRTLQFLCMTAIVVTIISCTADRMSEKGFRLPEGDPTAGQAFFLSYQCHECHSVSGETLPELPLADEPYVELGGPVTRVKTYGELVTGIINPSHRLAAGYARDEVSHDGVSKMINYNGHMTVQQLIDIVSYLQPHYNVVLPETVYRNYFP